MIIEALSCTIKVIPIGMVFSFVKRETAYSGSGHRFESYIVHLTLHANCDSPVLKQYKPLPLWSNAVFNDNNCFMTTFITNICENPDAAFELLMTLYTEEEKADIEHQQTAVGDYFRKSRTDFALGNIDPNSDTDWKTYVDTIWDLGLQDWLDTAQVAYDRG